MHDSPKTDSYKFIKAALKLTLVHLHNNFDLRFFFHPENQSDPLIHTLDLFSVTISKSTLCNDSVKAELIFYMYIQATMGKFV